MTRLIRRTSTTALAASLLLAATVAGAQDAGERIPGNDATLRDTPGVNAAMPPPLPASKSGTENDLGEHQVTGTVRELDSSTGTLVVDVKGKDVRVLFPGSALAKLEKGDEVTVTVGVHKNGGGSATQ
jgi:hypothetical protein